MQVKQYNLWTVFGPHVMKFLFLAESKKACFYHYIELGPNVGPVIYLQYDVVNVPSPSSLFHSFHVFKMNMKNIYI